MSKISYASGIFTGKAEGAVEKGDVLILGTAWPQVKKATADTDAIVGVAHQDATTGHAVSMVLTGAISTLRASAAISAGAYVVPTTDGEIKTASAGDQIFGIALEAATSANDDITCLLGAFGWLKA